MCLNQDEVLPAIYWARQLTSLIIGLAFGVVGFTGAGALMGYVRRCQADEHQKGELNSIHSHAVFHLVHCDSFSNSLHFALVSSDVHTVHTLRFAAIGSLLVYLYYSSFLGIDGEEMGQWDLLTEGGMPAFALFLVRVLDSFRRFHSHAF